MGHRIDNNSVFFLILKTKLMKNLLLPLLMFVVFSYNINSSFAQNKNILDTLSDSQIKCVKYVYKEVWSFDTENKPLFERVVTVTGKSVSRPCNILARIGTPINQLVEAAGGLPEDTGKVVIGGPMMGKAVSTITAPVTKGTSGVLILPQDVSIRPESYNCIRCGRCVSVCPMGLEPYLIKNMVVVKMFEELEKEGVLDCIECGSCAYTCPARVPLMDYIRLGKASLNKILRSKKS